MAISLKQCILKYIWKAVLLLKNCKQTAGKRKLPHLKSILASNKIVHFFVIFRSTLRNSGRTSSNGSAICTSLGASSNLDVKLICRNSKHSAMAQWSISRLDLSGKILQIQSMRSWGMCVTALNKTMGMVLERMER